MQTQQQIQLGDITVEVVRKRIKHIHLRVYPPDGRVRISAPLRMDSEAIRGFAMSKVGWIQKQQRKMQEQESASPRAYVDGESIYAWGKRCTLQVIESEGAASIEVKDGQMVVRVRPGSDAQKRQALVEAWYARQVKEAAPALIARWEVVMGVRVERFYVQRMKTRWGSCNPRRRSIRLNANLAKKPAKCVEYVIVHEMAHLLEPSHNGRFKALMDGYLPSWKIVREELNRAPLGHVEWEY